MRTKFVVRLLDAAGELLAWAEVWATPQPQMRADGSRAVSCPFWPEEFPTRLPIERAGEATRISIHWCDLDIARVSPLLEPMPVEPGQVYSWHWFEPVWLVAGMHEVPLPAVTERRSITLSPAPAQIGAVAGIP